MNNSMLPLKTGSGILSPPLAKIVADDGPSFTNAHADGALGIVLLDVSGMRWRVTLRRYTKHSIFFVSARIAASVAEAVEVAVPIAVAATSTRAKIFNR